MIRILKIGIIGDFDPGYPSHLATNEALFHAAEALSVTVEPVWIPTRSLEKDSGETDAYLNGVDAIWCSPGSPYISLKGALKGIRFAREKHRPFIGT